MTARLTPRVLAGSRTARVTKQPVVGTRKRPGVKATRARIPGGRAGAAPIAVGGWNG